jgi:hypothetical protein
MAPQTLCSLPSDFGAAAPAALFAPDRQLPFVGSHLELDPVSGLVISAEVQRDAVCGCARQVAERLVGLPASEVEEKAGLLHHHYPCLASMVKLPDYNKDTLMHESGHLLQTSCAAGEAVCQDLHIKPWEDG